MLTRTQTADTAQAPRETRTGMPLRSCTPKSTIVADVPEDDLGQNVRAPVVDHDGGNGNICVRRTTSRGKPNEIIGREGEKAGRRLAAASSRGKRTKADAGPRLQYWSTR